jgi:tetratricopeptide (TPR) repeat protein
MRARRRITVSAVLTALTLVACFGGEGDSWRKDLPEISAPGRIESFVPSVKDQYQGFRNELERARTDPQSKREAVALAYGRLGMWYHAYDFLEQAEACYRVAERLNPAKAPWPYYLGRIYERRQDFDNVRAKLNRTLEIEPSYVTAHVILGRVELDAGNLDGAQSAFQSALDREPGLTAAVAGLGEVALARRQYAEAVRLLEEAKTKQPKATQIQQSLGLAYRGLGKMDLAKRHLSAAKAPNHERVQVSVPDPFMGVVSSLQQSSQNNFLRAQKALQAGRTEEGLESFRRAIAADPQALGPRLAFGMALFDLDRREEALQVLRDAEAVGPNDPRVHASLGEALHRSKQLEPAEAHLRKALELDPRATRTRVHLALLLEQTNRVDEALREYAQASADDTSRRGARFLRSALLVRLGRHPEAEATLEEDLGRDPQAPGIRLMLARLLAASSDAKVRDGKRALEVARPTEKRPKERETASSSSAAKKPRRERRVSVALAETMAMAYAELGRFDEAIAWQRAAVGAATESTKSGAPWTRARLTLYEGGKPCREIVVPGERLLHRIYVKTPRAGADLANAE